MWTLLAFAHALRSAQPHCRTKRGVDADIEAQNSKIETTAKNWVKAQEETSGNFRSGSSALSPPQFWKSQSSKSTSQT
jgi:hypothetical protein